MKRLICLTLVVCILFGFMPVIAANEPSWTMPNGYYYATPASFKPVDNFHSFQNGPCFSWPIIYGATYELVVANDKDITDIAYRADDLKVNVYTFPYTFETGKIYYWAVRYKLNGKISQWSDVRRFYLDEKASEFTVADISDLGSVIAPHPRLYTAENIEAMSKVDQNDERFQTFKKSIDDYVNTKKVPEVIIKKHSSGLTDANSYAGPSQHIFNAALMYALTSDSKYLEYVRHVLQAIKDFNPEEMFIWDAYSNTVEMLVSYQLALAYDLLYNELTEADKKIFVTQIERNLKRPYVNTGKSGEMKSSLYTYPNDSHGWGLNRSTVAALAIYEDSELARKLVEFHLPILLSTPNNIEDGASPQGQFYGQPVITSSVYSFISKTGVADMMNKTSIVNTVPYLLYLWPDNWVGNFGDSYNTTPAGTYQTKQLQLFSTVNSSNPEYRKYAKWMLKRSNAGSTTYYYPSNSDFNICNANQDIEVELPFVMPNARVFAESGYVSMFSDLKDPNRIGLQFTSRQNGSNNHGHPDQNGFVIQAFGEELARDSDYYDSYHSSFDLGFNKKTYAHNAITFDDGTGQPFNSIASKGKIEGFVNQTDFKLASGNAEKAYGSALKKANRDIIYIYPDKFICIDDLATSGSEYTFEYWINTLGDISFYDNNAGALITSGVAAMDVNVHYPEKVTPHYIDFFAGPDLEPVKPPTSAENATDKRLYFQTEKTAGTKIITTLDVHKTDVASNEVDKKIYDDYVRLAYDNGTVCYVNISEKEKIETNDSISFEGLAFIYNSESYMLVRGKSAVVDGREIISSENEISVACGKDEISVSSLSNDSSVKIATDYIPSKYILQRDINKYDIPEGKTVSGISWSETDGGVIFNSFPGSYTVYTDRKELAGKPGKGVLKVEVDGEVTEIPFESIYDVNGKLTYDYWAKDFDDLYTLLDTKNVSIAEISKGDIFTLNKDVCLYISDENPYIKLKAIGSKEYEVDVDDDENITASKVLQKIRATDYAEGGKGTKVVYWNRINNNTLQEFNKALGTITYEVNVPIDGVYDVAMSVSTISNDTSNKILFIGDETGKFNIPPTSVYSDLQGLTIKCGVELKAGKNRITLLNTDNGQCIFDWIGLIKR